jgi:hypothetical protein
MAISLLTLPRSAKRVIRRLKNNTDLRGPLGGKNLRLARKGSRFAMDVSIPALTWAGCGAELAADLELADTELAQIAIPQPGFDAFTQGTPRVLNAGQSGRLLNVDGVTANITVPKGRFFNVTTAGRVRLYQLTEDCQATSLGALDLIFWPELRVSPADNDVVELSAPVIEGFADNDGWEIIRPRAASFDFSIVEPD